jgi:hypothetical protein
MAIFKSDDDAINFAIRKIYHDVLHREIESVQTQDHYRNMWKAGPADLVLAAIMDSDEGVKAMAAERKALGL